MRQIIILLAILTGISAYGLRKPYYYIVTGQLYGTPRHNYPDRINGKVFEVKYQAVWPREEKGKIVPGNTITGAERGALSLAQDFMEQYNTSGTITRFESINDEGQVTSYWKVETEGKIILKAENFNMNHVRTSYTVNSYTGNNLTEVKIFRDENSPVTMRIAYEYDLKGNRTRFQTFAANFFPGSYTEFSYNEDGNMEQSKVYAMTGNLMSEFNYVFDKKGKKISSHSQNFTKNTVADQTLVHEYDKQGNWIKEFIYKDDKPFYIRVREIKYYE